MTEKIAFISFSLIGGGAERNIINLARHLPKYQITPDIILLKNIRQYDKEYKKELNAINIVPILNYEKHINVLLKFIFIPVLFIRLYLYLKQKKYDVLIAAQEYYPFYITVLFAWLLKTRSIMLVGNNIEAELELKNPIVKFVEYYLFFFVFRYTDGIVFISHKLKTATEKFFKISPQKSVVIYSGVDINYVRALSKKKFNNPILIKLRQKGIKVITILGRLVKKKGHFRLIKLFRQVVRLDPAWHLLIIGTGKQAKPLQDLVNRYGLESSITFTGFLSNPYPYLKSAKVFIFASYFEGFGNVIIEAMSLGKTIISADCNFGPNEILTIKNAKMQNGLIGCNEGLLIKNWEERNYKKIALKILKKINNKASIHKMGLASKKRAKYFSVSKMTLNYKRYITKIIYK